MRTSQATTADGCGVNVSLSGPLVFVWLRKIGRVISDTCLRKPKYCLSSRRAGYPETPAEQEQQQLEDLERRVVES